MDSLLHLNIYKIKILSVKMGSKKLLKLESLVVTLLDRKMRPIKGKFKDYYIPEDLKEGISIADREGKIIREYGNFKISRINYSSSDEKITMTISYENYIFLGKPDYIEVSGKKIKKVN